MFLDYETNTDSHFCPESPNFKRVKCNHYIPQTPNIQGVPKKNTPLEKWP